jgi:hypothetical protein
MDLAYGLQSFVAQSFAGSEAFSSSPFTLMPFGGVPPWTGTGTYVVYIIFDASSSVFKTDVDFSNGSATINYNSMTNQSSLPAY